MANLRKIVCTTLAAAGIGLALYEIANEKGYWANRLAYGAMGTILGTSMVGFLLKENRNQQNNQNNQLQPRNHQENNNRPNPNISATYQDGRTYIDNRQDNRRITIIYPPRDPPRGP